MSFKTWLREHNCSPWQTYKVYLENKQIEALRRRIKSIEATIQYGHQIKKEKKKQLKTLLWKQSLKITKIPTEIEMCKCGQIKEVNKTCTSCKR